MVPKYGLSSVTSLCTENFETLLEENKITFRLQHSADQFERLLKEMCADEDGNLLIDSAVKGIPKVFVVSTLVSVVPAQPFVFRNYQVVYKVFHHAVLSVVMFLREIMQKDLKE